MRVAALFLLSCAWLTAQSGSFHGVAVDSQTGEPVAGVHIRLILGGFDGFSAVYGAMSDRAGKFSIDGMQPGTYMMQVEKSGFVCMMSRAAGSPFPVIDIKSTEAAEFRLEMARRAVITGRVVDEYGDPVENAQVDAVPVPPDGDAEAHAFPRSGITDERGGFRISGVPGKYYVRATSPEPSRPQEMRTDGTTESYYGRTYYPSAITADRAAVVEAAAGAERGGIEIRLTRQRMLSVRGTVGGVPRGAFVVISMKCGDSEDGTGTVRTVSVEPDGRFTFGRMPAASCRLFARAERGTSAMLSPVAEVRADGPDTVDLPLLLSPGVKVAGVVGMEGETAPRKKRKVSLVPASTDFGLQSVSAEADETGAFQLDGVMPGRYRVSVDPLPENGFVEALSIDGAKVAGREFGLTRETDSQLKITIASDGAELSGRLTGKDGKPVENTVAMVFLLEKPDDMTLDSGVRATAEGRFHFQGIAPGKYRLAAVDLLHSGFPGRRKELAKRFAAAEEIEIRRGQSIVKDLPLQAEEHPHVPAK